jgi:hypothetical protein
VPYVDKTWVTGDQVNSTELNRIEQGIVSVESDVTVLRSSPVNVKNYGAVLDGSTDDTAAFNAADAAGTGIYIPAGTARLGDWTPPTGASIEGAGRGTTVLKAKTAASYVMQLVALKRDGISNLTIDGNAKASHGLLIKGSGAADSQHHMLDRVTAQNCNRGVDVDTAAVDQVDKNTYNHCSFLDNTTGLRVASSNAQEQVLINPDFATNLTNIDISAGTLNIIGGQAQVDAGTNSKGILFSGPGVQWVSLDGFIFEGPDIDIDGTTYWPDVLLLRNCILQGLTNTILCTANNAKTIAEGCRFNNVAPRFNGTDQAFYELLPVTGSLAPNSSGSTQFRHMKTDINGIDFAGAYIKAQTMHVGFASLTAKRLTSSQQYVFRVDDESNNLLAAFGPKGELILSEQTGLGTPAANTVFLHSQDNGAGKTQLIAKWPGGTSTTIATEP